MSNPPPPRHSELLNEAFGLAEVTLARDGAMSPFAILTPTEGEVSRIYLQGIFDSPESKGHFANVIRFAALGHRADAVLFAAESWTVDISTDDEENMALLRDIQRRGASFEEHPRAIEIVMASVESDEGTTISSRKITRPIANQVVLVPHVEPSFSPPGGSLSLQGTLTNFVPPKDVREQDHLVKLAKVAFESSGALFIDPELTQRPKDH
jgi:hypothetical protein